MADTFIPRSPEQALPGQNSPIHKRKGFGINTAKTFLYLASVFGLYMSGQLIVAALLRAYGITDGAGLTNNPGALVVAYGAGMISIIGLLLGLIRLQKVKLSDIGLRKPKLSDFVAGAIGYGVYFVAVLVIFLLIALLIPGIDLNQDQDLGFSKNVSLSLLPLIFVALTILPPLAEELVFRGYLFTKLKALKYSKLTAAIVVSALFGALHGQLNVAIDTFVLSMVMLYVMEQQKGSLWSTMFMHFLKNSFAFVMIFIFKVN